MIKNDDKNDDNNDDDDVVAFLQRLWAKRLIFFDDEHTAVRIKVIIAVLSGIVLVLALALSWFSDLYCSIKISTIASL